MTRDAITSTPLLEVLQHRWSPRAFDESATLDRDGILAALEAARWTPSAMNQQPWRFIVAFRGDELFTEITKHLGGFNAVWAPRASAFVVNIAEVQNAEGKTNPWALYDLGQAVAHFTLQAHYMGLYTHQMGGVDAPAIQAALNVPAGFEVSTVTAVGSLGDPASLPEELAARERAPRSRHELTEIARFEAYPVD
jgi:nitroreductase